MLVLSLIWVAFTVGGLIYVAGSCSDNAAQTAHIVGQSSALVSFGEICQTFTTLPVAS